MQFWRHIIVGTGSIENNASLLRAVNLAHELTEAGRCVQLVLRSSEANRKLIEAYSGRLRVVWTEKRFVAEGIDNRGAGVAVFHAINPTLLSILIYLQYRRNGDILLSDWDEYPSRTNVSIKRRFEFRILEELHLQLAGKFVFSSQYLLHRLGKRVGRRPSAYIPYGYRTASATEQFDSSELKGARWVAYVGSFLTNYRNDVAEIVRLTEVGKKQGVMVLVIGDGPVLAEVKEKISEAKLNDSILFLGYMPVLKMEAYLRHQNIVACFLPLENSIANLSRCPNKLFQYMAAGKPVICPNIGEPACILQSSGMYYSTADSGSLALALESALKSQVHYDLSSVTWRFRASQLVDFLERNSS